MTTQAQPTQAITLEQDRTQVLRAALVAMTFGAVLVFTVGFAHPSTIHNAAHDTRHSLSFPCH
ncbi:CbtB domain-containing protein [Hyphomicrobium sp.]|uniref:CbtB domain-containing protein n=1 Tax=Hyphomicrobium sp. TaxID=82 RepID=UPI0039C86AAE